MFFYRLKFVTQQFSRYVRHGIKTVNPQKLHNPINSQKKIVNLTRKYLAPGAIGTYFTTVFYNSQSANNDDVINDATVKNSKLVIKNLVFQGGGPKGLAYVGALTAFEKEVGGFSEIERVAGASAGAITATLLAVGYTPKEIRKLLDETPLSSFIQDGTELDTLRTKLVTSMTHRSHIMKGLSGLWAMGRHPILSYQLINRVRTKRAICSGEKFREWMDDVIARKIAEIETGDIKEKERFKNLTFGELVSLMQTHKSKGLKSKYHHLYIVGAMMGKNTQEVMRPVFSTEDGGMVNYIISDAVRISMSIPGVFEPHSIYLKQDNQRKELEMDRDGIDGGILDNYPITLFDKNRYLSEPFAGEKPDSNYINYETLGFTLYDKRATESLWRWTFKIFKVQQNPVWQEDNEIPRDIKIDIRGVGLLDFNLPKEKASELSLSGETHTQNYFKAMGLKLKGHQDKEINRRTHENFDKLQKYAKFTNLGSNGVVKHYQVPDEYQALKPSLEDFSENNSSLTQLGIVGISGSGKTQLACYGASQYLRSHFWHAWRQQSWKEDDKNLPIIWFMKAETAETLLSSMIDLTEKLGCALNEKELKEKRETVQQKNRYLYKYLLDKLQHYPNYLFVFDNVVDHAFIQEYLEGDKHATILVTTQDETIKDDRLSYLKVVDLNQGLRLGASKTLMRRIYSDNPDIWNDNLEPLINKLAGLPLGLTVAAYYMREHGLTCEQYLKQWDIQHAELEKAQQALVQKNPRLLKKQWTQEAALLISINKVGENKLTYELLALCSCLNSDNIPDEILSAYITQSSKDETQDKTQSFLEDSLRQLRNYSLIRRDKRNKTLSMNQLVQEVVRRHHRPKSTSEWYDSLFRTLHAAVRRDILVEHDYYNKRSLIIHLEVAFANIPFNEKEYSQTTMWGYVDLGLLYKANGEAEKAIKHYKKLLPLVTKRRDSLTAEFYKGLGRACQGSGYFTEAKNYYEEAYNIYLNLPDLTTEMAETLNDLGMIWRDLGYELQKQNGQAQPNFVLAAGFLEKAVDTVKLLPTQKPNMIRYMTNLGEVYRLQKKLDEAFKIIKEAIDIGQPLLGKKHRLMASAYFNLGNVWKDRKNYQEAKQEAKACFEKAVEIDHEIFGETRHPLMARHIDALGLAFRELGNEKEACSSFKRSHDILRFSKLGQIQLKEQVQAHMDSCLSSSKP